MQSSALHPSSQHILLINHSHRAGRSRLRRGSATGNTAESLHGDVSKRRNEMVMFRTYGSVLAALLLAVVPPPVLSVTPRGPVATLTLARRPAGLSGNGLHVGLRNNLRGEVEELSEVGKTLLGESVVVPLPRELSLDVALRVEGLHSLDDLEVSDSREVRVGGAVEVLGGNENTLLEEVLVDLKKGSTSLLIDKSEPTRTALRFCLEMIILVGKK